MLKQKEIQNVQIGTIRYFKNQKLYIRHNYIFFPKQIEVFNNFVLFVVTLYQILNTYNLVKITLKQGERVSYVTCPAMPINNI